MFLQLIQYQEQGNLAFQLLIKSQLAEKPIAFTHLMGFTLTPVPPCYGTPDGFFNKTNKASLLHYILTDFNESVSYPTDTFFIQDGNSTFHSLKDLPSTFGGICLKILDQMIPKKNFVFSTDSYDKYSVKAQERLRRGLSKQFLIDGPSTRKPLDFKSFLQNDQNKEQLCDLLLRVWSSEKAFSRIESCSNPIIIKVEHTV